MLRNYEFYFAYVHISTPYVTFDAYAECTTAALWLWYYCHAEKDYDRRD